ncbi:cobalamin biosynthesis protein CobD [Anaerocolumna cellulosilytica]|uniref:Cobalamin biosynthesis protein CobD n=1 Tax=Anaerocolumna cellulosilytica TaxID=433286 RepID=A0A6S6R4W8_9FIRM|nr:adenosylcobinamide-phosphate synthase CbiB [Anaerocolumna cellulosilytica]MBB5196361.1 adenosylcobinamide-phosphate synthase [Anaerocolumna cellulosilytica]BCJ96389.1 cobalamin biosynthesis protein CobD [Anaerocolumna cellulosilytica]
MELLKYHTVIALILGYILDLLFGDPYWLPHPIRLIGSLINRMEKAIRSFTSKNPKALLMGGFLLLAFVATVSMVVPFLLLSFLYKYLPYAGLIVESIMCYQLLATKCLKDESMKVYHSLKQDNMEEARYHVSMIVGRDTKVLDKEGITKAAVETVAENTSDGVIAPMIFLAIGGPFLGFLYKAVNTLDSMVGYKNEKYLYFGRTSAKLDDVLNYIPSRIAAFLMILACPFAGLSMENAFKIYRRDNRNHSSPNSAQTEAACAGALGVQLAGDAWYFGKLHKKPTIGDALHPVETEDIKRANQLLYITSFLCLLLVSITGFLLRMAIH